CATGKGFMLSAGIAEVASKCRVAALTSGCAHLSGTGTTTHIRVCEIWDHLQFERAHPVSRLARTCRRGRRNSMLCKTVGDHSGGVERRNACLLSESSTDRPLRRLHKEGSAPDCRNRKVPARAPVARKVRSARRKPRLHLLCTEAASRRKSAWSWRTYRSGVETQ